MPKFGNTLLPNAIYKTLGNMIISQEIFGDLGDTSYTEIVDIARVDGSMYGDTKLYYTPDCLYSKEWGSLAEATKLLELEMPDDPSVQGIVLNKFRQIKLSLEEYLTKQAWMDEYAFSNFTQIMKGYIQKTKRIHDVTTYNAFIGNEETTLGKQSQTIDLTTAVGDLTGQEANRVRGAAVGQFIADLAADMRRTTRDYNDAGSPDSYNLRDMLAIWNSKYVNQIEKQSMPTTYHDQIVDKLGEFVYPPEFFGKGKNAATKFKATADTRSLVEQKITFAGGEEVQETMRAYTSAGVKKILHKGDKLAAGDYAYLFAQDSIPKDTVIAASGNVIYPSYDVDPNKVFILMDRRSVPFMSAFEVGGYFHNPGSLTNSYFYTWGYNTLEHLEGKPFIVVRAK